MTWGIFEVYDAIAIFGIWAMILVAAEAPAVSRS